MTKKEMFNEIRKVVIDNVEMVDFIDRELELLDRKSKTPRKPTKVQLENETLKGNILVALGEADEPVNIRGLVDICPALAELSNQRITHLLTALRKDGKVARTYVKKVAYFALGTEEDGE